MLSAADSVGIASWFVGLIISVHLLVFVLSGVTWLCSYMIAYCRNCSCMVTWVCFLNSLPWSEAGLNLTNLPAFSVKPSLIFLSKHCKEITKQVPIQTILIIYELQYKLCLKQRVGYILII